MGNDQPALRALFACESGLLEQEIRLEHALIRSFDLAKEERQMAKIFLSPSFDLVRESVSTAFD